MAFDSGDVERVKRNSSAEVCKAALEAGGLSVNCGGYLPQHLEAAVQNGTVNEDTLDAALTRTWEASISLGNFDTPNEQCVALRPAALLHTLPAQPLSAHVVISSVWPCCATPFTALAFLRP